MILSAQLSWPSDIWPKSRSTVVVVTFEAVPVSLLLEVVPGTKSSKSIRKARALEVSLRKTIDADKRFVLSNLRTLKELRDAVEVIIDNLPVSGTKDDQLRQLRVDVLLEVEATAD